MLEYGTPSEVPAEVPGYFVRLVGAVICQLPRDIDPATAKKWIDAQGELKWVLREALLGGKEIDTYPLIVDYGMSLEQMVKNGRYNWSHENITSKKFPTRRTGKAEIVIKLVRLNLSVHTSTAIEELNKEKGFRLAEPCELLAFGEKYPYVQRKFPVVALGFVRTTFGIYSDREALYLYGDRLSRYVGLLDVGDVVSDSVLDPGYYFALVRE